MSIELQGLSPALQTATRPHLQPTTAVHHPLVGMRRSYRSSADAMAYEAGWLAFSDGDKPPPLNTSFADGWHDAAAAYDRHAMHSLHRGED